MDIKNKIKIADMRSLIERMETKQPLFEANERREELICEALASNRKQVTRDEIIDILNQADDDPRINGKWASVTYVSAKDVYKTKKNWRPDDMSQALDKYKDRSSEDWWQKINDYNQEGAKGKNPVSTVVVSKRYLLHWTTKKHYDQQYSEYKKALADLRMSNGIGIATDGTLGDNLNQRQQSNTGVQFNQTGNLSKDFNLAGSRCKTTAYFVDETGHIIAELPSEVVGAMSAPKKAAKPEKAVAEVLTGEALEAYMRAKKELDEKFRPVNLLFDRMLCIAVSINGVSYYYINDALSSPIVKGSDVNVNPQEMLEIAKDQLGESFDEIQGFAN